MGHWVFNPKLLAPSSVLRFRYFVHYRSCRRSTSTLTVNVKAAGSIGVAVMAATFSTRLPAAAAASPCHKVAKRGVLAVLLCNTTTHAVVVDVSAPRRKTLSADLTSLTLSEWQASPAMWLWRCFCAPRISPRRSARSDKAIEAVQRLLLPKELRKNLFVGCDCRRTQKRPVLIVFVLR